ncbi:DUF5908 family protein [Tenacibaculum jejuense]|uniref:Uncharacterized protein n=1 Tax=Tenacibaculum jejuense TaxID=584609 RepID=A0A238UCN5_9FLAO|nr:DUF5908 family protein [Tenacibaculum jejuense]SNR16929.1 conserved protein of unknown function [Tenacibaculum jejuense]
MPVEIKELVIRAIISEEKKEENMTSVEERNVSTAIIQECVQEVLKVLKRQKRR